MLFASSGTGKSLEPLVTLREMTQFASEAAFLRNTATSPSSSPPLPFPLSNQPQHSPIALFVIPSIYLSTAKDDSVGSRLSTYGVSVLSRSFLLTEESANTFSMAKEGDGGVKPIHERARKSDWPTLVFGCGVSESLSRLRIGAAWWLTKDLNALITCRIACSGIQLRPVLSLTPRNLK
jgi:hypothetical protein